jgi:hypothetical protein
LAHYYGLVFGGLFAAPFVAVLQDASRANIADIGWNTDSITSFYNLYQALLS